MSHQTLQCTTITYSEGGWRLTEASQESSGSNRHKLQSDIDPDGVDWIVDLSDVFMFVSRLYKTHAGKTDSYDNQNASSSLTRNQTGVCVTVCLLFVYVNATGKQIITLTSCFSVIDDKQKRLNLS